MSMACLTRVDYNSTRPVYVSLQHVVMLERIESYTRIELTNGTFLKVSEMPEVVLVQMGEWDMADNARYEVIPG